MRKSVLIAAATISLLSACGEQAVENEAESAATNNATATPAATEKSAPPAAPATKQEALKIMHDRHEGMEQIGKATKAIGQQLKAENPNVGDHPDECGDHQRPRRQVGELVPGRYRPGRRQDPREGRDLAEVRRFRSQGPRFPCGCPSASRAADSADVNAIKPAFADLGKACKACHDPYRAEEKKRD